MLHLDDFIRTDDGRRRYLVTCDMILPNNYPNPLRRGTVCGNRRYLRISDARRVKMCESCAQRLKGKKGYAAATKTVNALGYETLPSAYLSKHLSRGESAVVLALNQAGVLFQQNVRVPNCQRQWLMDIFVQPNLCVEIDDPWVHAKCVELDDQKEADLRAAGIQLLRVRIDAKKNIPTQVEQAMPVILRFLKENAQCNSPISN